MQARPQRLERLPQQYFVDLLERVSAATAARVAAYERRRDPVASVLPEARLSLSVADARIEAGAERLARVFAGAIA